MMKFTVNDFVEVYRRVDLPECPWLPIMNKALGHKGYVRRVNPYHSAYAIDFIDFPTEQDGTSPAGFYFPSGSLRPGGRKSEPEPEKVAVKEPFNEEDFFNVAQEEQPSEGKTEEVGFSQATNLVMFLSRLSAILPQYDVELVIRTKTKSNPK